MSSVREDTAKEVLFSWARQTIAFAISIRADETGKDLTIPKVDGSSHWELWTRRAISGRLPCETLLAMPIMPR